MHSVQSAVHAAFLYKKGITAVEMARQQLLNCLSFNNRILSYNNIAIVSGNGCIGGYADVVLAYAIQYNTTISVDSSITYSSGSTGTVVTSS